MGSAKQCREIASRRESVSLMLNKMSEEGLWDSLKAKDVPDDIIQHVLAELELGKSPQMVRREMGIGSQTSKEWQKISAAIKLGYRVNTPTFFHKIFTRTERIGDKIDGFLNDFLDQDRERLKELDKDGIPLLDSYVKCLTPMVDSYNRLLQGQVKIGRDLGVFTDPNTEGKGTTGGVTIIVKSNIQLPSTQEMAKKKIDTVEVEVVGQKELSK